jgi:DNA-binding MarR family transcriptional regulator
MRQNGYGLAPHQHSELVQQVLELQTRLFRSMRPAREWLEVDLTMPQLKVMFLLYAEGGATMGQLAGSLGVTLPTVTGIADRLVEHRLVQRQEAPHDRRRVLCHLTDEGLATVEQLHQSGRSRMSDVLASLSEPELQAIVTGLQVLTSAVQRHAVDGDESAGDSLSACASRA